MFKDTPLLSAITVMEIFQQARVVGAEQFGYLEPFTMVGIMFLSLSVIASQMMIALEKRYVVRHS
jgi:polar amino acid transport system permease protein